MTIPATASSSEGRPTGERGVAPRAGRTGVVLRDPLSWPQLRQVAETAEETGFEAIFVPEIAGREAFATLAALATCTSSIRLGTGVITVQSRNPPTAAMGAATIQDLSEGRMILGIGAGTGAPRPGAPTPQGERPVDVVREYVREVKSALAGQTRGSGFGLDLELVAGPPPVWSGALGDRMISLAGEIADGVILNWCTPARVAEARKFVGRGAAAMGRNPGDVTVAVYVRACLGLEEPVALEALREMTGRYASFSHYARQFVRMGLGEEAAVAAKAFEVGRPQDIPESLVRAVAITGGRREALARFEEYFEAGADVVLCYPVSALDAFSSILGTVLAAAPSPGLEH